jgi:Putative Ig domain
MRLTPTMARNSQSLRPFKFGKIAALIGGFCYVMVLSACSGISVPGKANAASTNPVLTISNALPSATVGAMYNATLNVSGGTSPYSFSVASGALPNGDLLGDETGTISGIPTTTGSFSFSILVSDSKGLSQQQSFTIAVSNAAPTGNSFAELQQSTGWSAYGQGPPDFVNCSPSPCDGITFSMSQGIASPSLSGDSAQFSLGGTAVYSDAFFNNHLIGDLSSQGMPDPNHTLVPTFHNFTYDVYFYAVDLALSQALEFDVNQYFDNMGFTWGHQCRIAEGSVWDVWDNVNQKWVPTGVACNPVSNSWNHLTIQVQRTSDNQVLYESVTLNGVTSSINQYYSPGSAVGWNGIVISYQVDGNYEQSPYSVYLDNLTLTYE